MSILYIKKIARHVYSKGFSKSKYSIFRLLRLFWNVWPSKKCNVHNHQTVHSNRSGNMLDILVSYVRKNSQHFECLYESKFEGYEDLDTVI